MITYIALSAALSCQNKNLSNFISSQCNEILEKKAVFSIISSISQKEIWHHYTDCIEDEKIKNIKYLNKIDSDEYLGTTKIKFHIYSLAYSIIQKCNFCIKINYEILKKEGLSIDNISDIGRIVSVIKGLSLILNAPPSVFPKPIYL